MILGLVLAVLVMAVLSWRLLTPGERDWFATVFDKKAMAVSVPAATKGAAPRTI